MRDRQRAKSDRPLRRSRRPRNFAAVDLTLAHLHEVPVGPKADSPRHRPAPVPKAAPDFVQRVTGRMIAGDGDLLR